GQVSEIVDESIRCIKIVFRKCKCACGGGGPGIDERRLQHLIFFAAAPYKAAPVFYHDVYVGTQINAAAQLRILLPHDGGGDDGINLDAGDVVAARGQRARHIPSAAGADDEALGGGPDRVGQAGTLVEQIAPVALGQVVEIEIRDAGGGVGIDENHRRT